MRQRRQVAARADRTLFRNDRDHIAVQQFGQRLQRRGTDAGMAAHQRVDADRQHRAHDARRQRLADADRVGDHEVALQLFHQRAVVPALIKLGRIAAR
jgi:hypothetical protein